MSSGSPEKNEKGNVGKCKEKLFIYIYIYIYYIYIYIYIYTGIILGTRHHRSYDLLSEKSIGHFKKQ